MIGTADAAWGLYMAGERKEARALAERAIGLDGVEAPAAIRKPVSNPCGDISECLDAAPTQTCV